MRIRCGPFLVFSDFDSGNILSAELVGSCLEFEPAGADQNQHSYELNIFTKPDCYDTVYQNGNRTWFHFGIQGGDPGSIMKINILNLNKQVKLFSQGMQPVFRYLPSKAEWERVRDRLIINEKKAHPAVCTISFRQKLPDSSNSVLYIAFTYPFSYVELVEWLNSLDTLYLTTKSSIPFLLDNKNPKPSKADLLLLQSAQSVKNQIYYHRELVCYSLEGRRVECITITSREFMLESREERLSNLFPIQEEERSHKFANKKIVFISARVHPGETPSSFVLNGMFKFLLEPLDPRALMLRRLFVFKFLPCLNPDGVAHGHYRTDTRGVNLNRVYLRPSPLLHPSIYASRKLILYYHFGKEMPENYGEDITLQTPEAETSEGLSTEMQIENSKSSEAMPNQSNLPECIPLGISHEDQSAEGSYKCNKDMDSANSYLVHSSQRNMPYSEDQMESTFEACDEDSLVYAADARIREQPTSSGTSRNSVAWAERQDSAREDKLLAVVSSSKKLKKPASKKRKAKSKCRKSNPLINSSNQAESGLFCYIDMHGHATKRGIFMYGNHFSDPNLQAECMLLPRLMSMNCGHFDFSACNFTERLMSMRDRRDGASREGSGRVAIYKLTGVVRSYTLECNYNAGRTVNHILNRATGTGVPEASTKYSSLQPPKFTPELFEDAGKSLAISLLDLTGRNAWSRIGLTEFRTIDGMRKWLRNRVMSSPEFGSTNIQARSACKTAELSSQAILSSRLKAKKSQARKKIKDESVKLTKACSSKSLRKSSTSCSSFDKATCSSLAKVKLSSLSKTSINIEPKRSLLDVFKVRKKSKRKTKEKLSN